MNPIFYDETRNHTNTVEQSHYKSYFLRVYDSLLGAVTKYVSLLLRKDLKLISLGLGFLISVISINISREKSLEYIHLIAQMICRLGIRT
jgi:hypothetical protein